jgi:hypothetical protein
MSTAVARVRDSDVVLQRPGSERVAIDVHETPTACAGAATSYVLRRIASRAGAYAPGIDEAIFLELHAAGHGHAVDDVARWFAARSPVLDELGYPLRAHRVGWTVPDLAVWIAAGRGYRGAVLATSYARLHPQHPAIEAGDVIAHAVGLTCEGCEAGGDGTLVMIDSWSRTGAMRGRVHPALELAHRDRELAALLFHWRGWV